MYIVKQVLKSRHVFHSTLLTLSFDRNMLRQHYALNAGVCSFPPFFSWIATLLKACLVFLFTQLSFRTYSTDCTRWSLFSLTFPSFCMMHCLELVPDRTISASVPSPRVLPRQEWRTWQELVELGAVWLSSTPLLLLSYTNSVLHCHQPQKVSVVSIRPSNTLANFLPDQANGTICRKLSFPTQHLKSLLERDCLTSCCPTFTFSSRLNSEPHT